MITFAHTARLRAAICVLVTIGLWSASAAAELLFTFGFTDAMGSFDPIVKTYDVVATAETDGDVTRTVAPEGTAWFTAPWTGGTADFSVSMTLSSITSESATVSPGDGSMTITDADGDAITAGIAGEWTRENGVFAVFNGGIIDAVLTGTTFDGPSGGSFSTDFSNVGAEPPFQGTVLQLSFMGAYWFDSQTPFSDVDTLVQGAVIPEPASTLLLILGMGFAVPWRRR